MIRILIWILLAILLLPTPLMPIEPLVERSVYLTVEDGDRLIGGLTEENFRVSENGESRDFRLEEPELPVMITLLVEHSRMAAWYWDDITQSLSSFVRSAPDGHWYSLVTYAQTIEVASDFTRNRAEILDAWSRLGQPMWRDVNTYDAIYETAEKLQLIGGRHVVVLIGSGIDTFSRRTLGEAQRKVEATGATIFGIGAGSALRGRLEMYLGTNARMELLRAQAFLQMLADKTGGQAFFPRFVTAFPNVMRSVLLMVGHQYRLIYDSQPRLDRPFQDLEVEAFVIEDDRRKDFTVRVRDGWREE